MTTPVFPIVPSTQKYDWGKRGLQSKVAQFAHAARVPGFALDENTPYAELWMGTHASSPSLLLDGTPLAQHLAENPSLIGDDIVTTFHAEDGNIPFLFKILAIEKALSIQTHPDKQTAEKLHAEQPTIYKDPNHKPEMAIALTPFTALCGFLPLPQIATFISSTSEFSCLIPSTIASHFISISTSRTPSGSNEKSALRELFSALMTAPEEKFKEELKKLVTRYKDGREKPEERDVKELILRLEEQFPGDIGIFCSFMLNYVKLNPGEAIFLGAGEPHAYISGDIVETMATSDNVIRAGLTPKLRDVPNLISSLTYTSSDPSKHLIQPRPFGSPADPFADLHAESILYDPPVPEFAVVRVEAQKGSTVRHEGVRGPSIFIVTKGRGRVTWDGQEGEQEGEQEQVEKGELSEGRVYFIGAKTGVVFEAEEESLEIYRAFVEPKPPSF
ncbi:mannos-6-phosphate isomerase [Fomitiporia mediterranea MF3/22]|uniref:mannos-6-phosphate isomerase n=1 Tax=Fomitiporia mediterranea (strain MF3/22) TaxID=694068 RepID=UPI0004409992|nr:mannos-6-phosphate isomerase [Fomitiporia mediterranea MF3/22]EJD06904.1 mannos-6-phosphate isomerase [Fomitiporia mediterranea MF3/22]